MKKIKFRTEFSNDFNNFTANAGNGKNELQFEVKDGKPVIKVDSNGEPITYNRWNAIQQNKNTNNYKKLLEAGADIKLFQARQEQFVDTTQFGNSGADLLTAKAKLNNQNINVEDLKVMLVKIYENQVKLQQENQKQKMEEQNNKKEIDKNVDKK